jgi:hypothetical protein
MSLFGLSVHHPQSDFGPSTPVPSRSTSLLLSWRVTSRDCPTLSFSPATPDGYRLVGQLFFLFWPSYPIPHHFISWCNQHHNCPRHSDPNCNSATSPHTPRLSAEIPVLRLYHPRLMSSPLCLSSSCPRPVPGPRSYLGCFPSLSFARPSIPRIYSNPLSPLDGCRYTTPLVPL